MHQLLDGWFFTSFWALVSWNPKQPFINGCFNWMIPNLYIGNGCFTKHLFINGCLGFQVGIGSKSLSDTFVYHMMSLQMAKCRGVFSMEISSLPTSLSQMTLRCEVLARWPMTDSHGSYDLQVVTCLQRSFSQILYKVITDRHWNSDKNPQKTHLDVPGS